MSYYDFGNLNHTNDEYYKTAINFLTTLEDKGMIFGKISDKDYYCYNMTNWKRVDTSFIKQAIMEYISENYPHSKSLDKLIKGVEYAILSIIPLNLKTLKGMLASPPVLNLKNTTLHFNSDGSYVEHAHSPEQYQFSCSPIFKTDDYECPHMNNLLDSVFASYSDKADMIQYIYALIGYSLSSLSDEPIILFLKGNGANGKSTLLNVITALFSDNCVLYEKIDTFTKDIFNSSSLMGKKLIIDDDLNENAKIKTGLLKQLSERKTISARFPYGLKFNFTVNTKIIMAGNVNPKIEDCSDGFRRRLIVIPFTNKFSINDGGNNIVENILEQELPAIINKSLDAMRAVVQYGGFQQNKPVSIEQATEMLFDDLFPLKSFLCDSLCKNVKDHVPLKSIRDMYPDWANNNGYESKLANHALKSQIENLGYSTGKMNGYTSIKGYSIVDNSDV